MICFFKYAHTWLCRSYWNDIMQRDGVRNMSPLVSKLQALQHVHALTCYGSAPGCHLEYILQICDGASTVFTLQPDINTKSRHVFCDGKDTEDRLELLVLRRVVLSSTPSKTWLPAPSPSQGFLSFRLDGKHKVCISLFCFELKVNIKKK